MANSSSKLIIFLIGRMLILCNIHKQLYKLLEYYYHRDDLTMTPYQSAGCTNIILDDKVINNSVLI